MTQSRIPPRAHDHSGYPDYPYESERVIDERMADSIAKQNAELKSLEDHTHGCNCGICDACEVDE